MAGVEGGVGVDYADADGSVRVRRQVDVGGWGKVEGVDLGGWVQ